MSFTDEFTLNNQWWGTLPIILQIKYIHMYIHMYIYIYYIICVYIIKYQKISQICSSKMPFQSCPVQQKIPRMQLFGIFFGSPARRCSKPLCVDLPRSWRRWKWWRRHSLEPIASARRQQRVRSGAQSGAGDWGTNSWDFQTWKKNKKVHLVWTRLNKSQKIFRRT